MKHSTHQSSGPAAARAREIFASAQHVVVFSGAGMSAESGLNTYRDADSGLWEGVDPLDMASIDAWERDPEPMWRWYHKRRRQAAQAEPNAGHLAIGAWGNKAQVVTQNIDNLHERGGATSVVHLHGSLFEFRCAECARAFSGDVETEGPPLCPACGGLIRPGVVWFGEALPQREWEMAEEEISLCDFLLIVGTSGVVSPAAQLPFLAEEAGVPIVEISPQETGLSPLASVLWKSTAARALPQLATERDSH
ncbi:NAD-dependent deacylase [Corynebacterium flavescens]|uniref:NAD-dependent deacylase n=1 Tax=Corynebacterium flavescens TaxID=28028 RepID=UPI003F8FC37F